MRKTINPYLSIIIPVYNRQDSLTLLLKNLSNAVVAGNYINEVEIIIIDDCSKELVSLDGEFSCSFRLQRNKKNSGAPFSRERGFKLSNAPFIHFHDSDDSISENWLSGVLGEIKNNPDTDLLLTGRVICKDGTCKDHYQKFCHRNVNKVNKIAHRLVYQNCIGPLGGVTFSRRVLEEIHFSKLVSCQDWQMYISVMPFVRSMRSCPEIRFCFNVSSDDRISASPNRKLLGHLQLSKTTSKKTPFKQRIRLFYLAECKIYLKKRDGQILAFYNNNKVSIYINHLLIKVYWKISEFFL